MRFPTSRPVLAWLLALALSAVALHAAGEPGLPAVTKPKPGTVQGWVCDSAGQPLAGAVVHIYGTTMAGQNTRFEVTVGQDGRYRQRVPEGIYGVRAEHVVEVGGKSFPVALHPIDGVTAKTHDSEEGVAKDFVWRIAGLRPGAKPGEAGTHNEPGKYYGGSLQVSVAEEGFATEPPLPAGATLIAMLTPDGPLFDGRPAKPLEFRRTFSEKVRSSSYWYPCDIPLGRYTLRMSVEIPGQGGRALTLKKSLEFSAPFADSAALEVVPSSTSGAALPIQITVNPKG